MASETTASAEVGSSMPSSPPQEDLFRADFNADLEVREDPGEGPILTGHFARFGEWAEINSRSEGHFLERMAHGAFTKTIAEGRERMRVLFNHGQDVLGQQILGPIRSLKEDDYGAHYEVPLFDGIPPLILAGLRAHQYGSSFRFAIMRQNYESRPKQSDYNPKGLPERTVQEARVREFGPVTFGAYSGATAGVRSITDDVRFSHLIGDPERLRAMIAEEVAKNNRITISLSGVNVPSLSTAETVAFVEREDTPDPPEPDPSGDTTPDEPEPEPEPSAATTRTEPGLEPEPSGVTTPPPDQKPGHRFDTREEWLQWICKT